MNEGSHDLRVGFSAAGNLVLPASGPRASKHGGGTNQAPRRARSAPDRRDQVVGRMVTFPTQAPDEPA